MKRFRRNKVADPVYLVFGGFIVTIAVWAGLCYHVFGLSSILGCMCCVAGIVGFRIIFELLGMAASQPSANDAAWQAGDGSLRKADPSRTALIGSAGKTMTALRPSGYIVLNGQRYDAVAAGEFIEKDTPIRISGIHQDQFIVDQISQNGNAKRVEWGLSR